MFLFHFLVQEIIHLNDVVAVESVPIAASGSAASILNVMIYCGGGGHDDDGDSDDDDNESKDGTEESIDNDAKVISRNTQYTRRMREPSTITTTAKKIKCQRE